MKNLAAPDGAQRAESQKLNLAIIGVLGYGKHVLDSFLPLVDEGRVHFTGAAVQKPEAAPEACALLQKNGCEIFTDYREMIRVLSGQIDLYVIPTGIESHRPMACEAMEHGAHIFVEKPLAGSVADAQAILTASERWNRRVAVGFQDLCSEPIRETKRRILQGDVGELKSIRAVGAWPRGFAYYQRNTWAGRLLCDGKAVFDSPLNNAFGHLLNLSLFFAGAEFTKAATPVEVQGELYRTYPIESFDTAAIHVLTERQVKIDCYVSHAAEQEISPRLVMEGTRGRIEWQIEKNISLIEPGGQVRWSLALETAPQLRQTVARVTTQTIAHDEPLVNNAESAFSHVLAIEKLHAAAVIQDVPKSRIIASEEKLAINGSTDWLQQGFIHGSPLLLEKIGR